MSTPVDLRELVERLQIALSQLEEAEEVVAEASIEVRDEIERVQRATGSKWDEQMVELVNYLELSKFQRPVDLPDAYVETGQLIRLCNWLEEMEKPEESTNND